MKLIPSLSITIIGGLLVTATAQAQLTVHGPQNQSAASAFLIAADANTTNKNLLTQDDQSANTDTEQTNMGNEDSADQTNNIPSDDNNGGGNDPAIPGDVTPDNGPNN